jgi:hypothetical protein
MSRKRHDSKTVSNSASSRSATSADSAAQLTHRRQALGLALAGGALSTPLLLALFEKVLSFDEIKSVCCRAREIAAHFEDLPEGKFALACLDDFLLPRSLNRETESSSPTIVPSDAPDASQPSAADSSQLSAPDGSQPSYDADITITGN